MRAIILAAGIGWRLGGGEGQPPKCLIRFEGQSLLERHLRILREHGVTEVVVGVGYQADRVRAEIERCGFAERVRTVYNPDFREGNVVTLWCLREHLRRGAPVLLMDADVLYHGDLMARLLASPHEGCFLLDRDFEPGDEPVKICTRAGRPVEFGKVIPPGVRHDQQGESVGFFKLSPGLARELARTCERYVDAGRRDAFYEDALRDVLLADAAGRFGCEDITGLPWIEIDFQADVRRAEEEVMPRILALEAA